MEVWICGHVHEFNDGKDGSYGWSFHGVYLTQDKAVEACIDEYYFIGPAVIDKGFPHEIVEWVGAYYPITNADS